MTVVLVQARKDYEIEIEPMLREETLAATHLKMVINDYWIRMYEWNERKSFTNNQDKPYAKRDDRKKERTWEKEKKTTRFFFFMFIEFTNKPKLLDDYHPTTWQQKDPIWRNNIIWEIAAMFKGTRYHYCWLRCTIKWDISQCYDYECLPRSKLSMAVARYNRAILILIVEITDYMIFIKFLCHINIEL